jgi:hypothetical protein
MAVAVVTAAVLLTDRGLTIQPLQQEQRRQQLYLKLEAVQLMLLVLLVSLRRQWSKKQEAVQTIQHALLEKPPQMQSQVVMAVLALRV